MKLEMIKNRCVKTLIFNLRNYKSVKLLKPLVEVV